MAVAHPTAPTSNDLHIQRPPHPTSSDQMRIRQGPDPGPRPRAQTQGPSIKDPRVEPWRTLSSSPKPDQGLALAQLFFKIFYESLAVPNGFHTSVGNFFSKLRSAKNTVVPASLPSLPAERSKNSRFRPNQLPRPTPQPPPCLTLTMILNFV